MKDGHRTLLAIILLAILPQKSWGAPLRRCAIESAPDSRLFFDEIRSRQARIQSQTGLTLAPDGYFEGSGVGAKSAAVAYGFNRDGSTYIPGGVVSGVSLIRPKFPDHRARPWDWYQTEYVINGSAAYVFNVLAAESLLSRP